LPGAKDKDILDVEVGMRKGMDIGDYLRRAL
jgi:hypothetical protein